MNWLFRGAVIAFFAGLGGAVAVRMGSEAMAVVVGVVLGVAGTLPVALLILYAVRRAEPRESEKPSVQPAGQPWQQASLGPAAPPPQIIVVPQAQMPMPPRSMGGWYPQQPALPPVQREFNIIGEDS
ncbi:MAG: hypothetical protein U0822_23600 [Anaerolineae bacterium]